MGTGWGVTVLSLRTTRARVESDDLVVKSLGADALFGGYWRQPFGFWRDLRALVAQAEAAVGWKTYDLILAAWAFPAGYVARGLSARHEGPPYAIWSLGSDIWRARRNPVYRRALRHILRGAALLLTDAPSLAGEIESVCGRSNIHVCPALAPAPGECRPPSEPRSGEVAFVGRYECNKGPDVLARALRILHRELDVEIPCTFYGAGSLEPKLLKWTVGLPKVSVKGPLARTDLFELLPRISALVIPSRRESLPSVLYDAMQAGTPVVVSDSGDMKALATQRYAPDGYWVFPSGDAGALAKQLRHVSASARSSPSGCALRQPFDPVAYLHEALELLQRMMLKAREERGAR